MSNFDEKASSLVARRRLLRGLVGLGLFSGGAISASTINNWVKPRIEKRIRDVNLYFVRHERKEPLAGVPLKVGIVGAGNRGSMLAEILNRYPASSRIDAICDILPERNIRLKARLKSSANEFLDYREMLARQPLDMVLIATPNVTHAEMAVATLQKNIHVFLEKPMATTEVDCDRIIQAANQTKAVVQLGYEFRYSPLYLKLKELIDEGVVGEVRMIVADELRDDWFTWYPNDPIKNRNNWRYSQAESGGSIVEKLCHDFDIYALILNSTPKYISAVGGRAVYLDRETIDHAAINVLYSNGVQFSINFSLFAPSRASTMIIGERGTLSFDRSGTEIRIIRGTGHNTKVEAIVDAGSYTSDPFPHQGTEECLLDLFAAIKDKRNFSHEITQGKQSIRTALLAEQSVASKGAVINYY